MENAFILAAAGIQPKTITEMQSWKSPQTDPLLHTNPWDVPAFNHVVSSTAGSNIPYVSNESVLIRELIGKLGGDGGNPTEILQSPCYSTPMTSPLKLENTAAVGVDPNLAEFAADPGFAERAARFSFLGSRSFNGRTGSYMGTGVEFHQGHFPAVTAAREVKLGRVSSSPSLNGLGPRTEIGVPLGSLESPEEESSLTAEANPRKRKGVSTRGKTKEPASSIAKRRKEFEGDGDCEADTESKQNKMSSNPAESPKDYIHVRARRGQATDSHSLAERVRREKISERMKLLQDLVPGCNKVTGKAVMLDEIINYVQSLQRQVEFLSMKLSSVNTSLDPLLSNDHHQPRLSSKYDDLSSSLHQLQMFPSTATDHFPPHSNLQYGGGDDLHSIVRMGLGDRRMD